VTQTLNPDVGSRFRVSILMGSGLRVWNSASGFRAGRNV